MTNTTWTILCFLLLSLNLITDPSGDEPLARVWAPRWDGYLMEFEWQPIRDWD
jgi:hypothetical protein